MLAILVWSVAPFVNHTPQILDRTAAEQQMIEDHGHSHGAVADLSWLLHGHAPDRIDHDHSQAVVKAMKVGEIAVSTIHSTFPPTDLRGAAQAPPRPPPRVVTAGFAQRTV